MPMMANRLQKQGLTQLQDDISRMTSSQNSFSIQESVTPERVRKSDDLIYDVGMHKGEDTDFYLRKGFRVIGFEADPDLCAICRHRFEREIRSGQLVLLEGAIQPDPAPADGKVWFYKNETSVWGTTVQDFADRNARFGSSGAPIAVAVIDFRRAIREFGVPRYLKIDIEGCDMVCVRILREFSPRPDFISIESDKSRFTNIRAEIEALEALGYNSFKAIEQSSIPRGQTPPNPPKEGKYAPQTFPLGASGLFGSELDGAWLSKRQILLRYRFIRLGYYLVGDDGILTRWKLLRFCTVGFLRLITGTAVPGWYDTHACRSIDHR